MTTLKGKVLYWKPNDDGIRGFGFITPLGCNGMIDRDKNLWFGPRELDGASVEAGDVVSYEINDERRKHTGPRAKHVRVLHKSEVTTLPGCDEI